MDDVCVDSVASRLKQADLYASLSRMGYELEDGWSAVVSVRRAGNSAGTKVGRRLLARAGAAAAGAAAAGGGGGSAGRAGGAVAAGADGGGRRCRPRGPHRRLPPPPRTPTTGRHKGSGSAQRRRWRRSWASSQVRACRPRGPPAGPFFDANVSIDPPRPPHARIRPRPPRPAPRQAAKCGSWRSRRSPTSATPTHSTGKARRGGGGRRRRRGPPAAPPAARCRRPARPAPARPANPIGGRPPLMRAAPAPTSPPGPSSGPTRSARCRCGGQARPARGQTRAPAARRGRPPSGGAPPCGPPGRAPCGGARPRAPRAPARAGGPRPAARAAPAPRVRAPVCPGRSFPPPALRPPPHETPPRRPRPPASPGPERRV
jgi:hypothetical protein